MSKRKTEAPMKTITKKVGTHTVRAKIYTEAGLKRLSESDRKFVKDMSNLADDMIRSRL